MKTSCAEKTAEVLNNIKRIREQNHFSQKDIADRLGVSQTAYSKLECGLTQLRLNHMHLLAEIFGVDIKDLLGSIR